MGSLLLDAATVARNAGVELRPKGSRWWARCPIHGEKTASLCFYPDGRCHCFGCGFDGDAADLYAALHGVSLAEALRAVKGDYRPMKLKQPTAEDLYRKLEAWKSGKWAEACQALHHALATICALENAHSPSQLMCMEAFWTSVDQMASANDTLNLLDSATMAQLLKMCVEDE